MSREDCSSSGSSLLDDLDVGVEVEEEERELTEIRLHLIKEASDEEFGFTIADDPLMKLIEVRDGTPACRAGLTQWIGSRLVSINEQRAEPYLVATSVKVNTTLSLVFTFAPLPSPPPPPQLTHAINILGTSDDLLLTGSKGSTDTHSKDTSEPEKKYMVAEHPNQVPSDGEEVANSSGETQSQSATQPADTAAAENVLQPPDPSAPTQPAPAKKKLRIQANWDRVFAASIQKVAEKRQTEAEKEEELEKASRPKRLFIFAKDNLTWKNMSTPAYEISVIAFVTAILTATVGVPACIGLATGDWHNVIAEDRVMGYANLTQNTSFIDNYTDHNNNNTFIEISEHARTRWVASEWVVLGLMQYAITFCLVPWDAWRWVSTTKLISTAAIVMWLFTEKVEGFIEDDFYMTALLIHVGVAFGDFFYLLAIKRARPWINIAAVLFPAAYGFILFHYLLRPYEKASPGEQIGLRVFLFPPVACLINTVLTWISRHWSVTDIHHLKIGLSLSSIAISAAIGRIMTVHAPPEAQGAIITLTAIITLIDRVTYLSRSAALDFYTQTILFKRTKAEAYDFINSSTFREAVSTEYLFILICEFSAIVSVGLLRSAGWNDARFFFDLYSPNGEPNGVVGSLLIVQLLVEVVAAVVSSPLQQITYCMSFFQLPLFHTAVRFTDRPRLVIIGIFSITFIIHLMLSCQKSYLKWVSCTEYSFYDSMVCPEGGIYFPNQNKSFCCDWEDSYLENVNLYYP